MFDRLGYLHGEIGLRYSIGQTGQNGGPLSHILDDGLQKVRRAGQPSPCMRKTHS